MPIRLRLALALLAYAFLGLMAWRTMEPDKMRLVTFAVLGLLAFRTVTHATRLNRESGEEQVGSLQSRDSESAEPVADSRLPNATKSRE